VLPWWNKPLRVIQFNLEDPYGFYAYRVNDDLLLNLASKLHANMIVVFARDAWGRVFYDGSKLYPRHPNSNLDVSHLVEKGKSKGIHVVVMSAHTANRFIYRLHPSWAQRTKEGEVVVLEHYPTKMKIKDPHWPLICINSPAMDEYFIPEVEESLKATGADGVLLDSFRYMPDPERACYCKHCQAKFKRDTGFDLPMDDSADEEAYRLAWEWRENSVVNALRKLWRASKQAGNEIMFFFNSHPAGWSGRGNVIVEKSRSVLDAVFAEASEADTNAPGMLTLATKLTRGLLGDDTKPVFVSRNLFYLLRTTQSPPPVHVRQGIREIVAAGGQPWVLLFSSQLFEDPRALEAVEQVYGELDKAGEYLDTTKPVSHIAVAFSTETHEKAYRESPEFYVGEVSGFTYMLSSLHIPWDIVSLKDIDKHEVWSRYKTIILPNTTVISDNCIRGLTNFAYNGGYIIASHELGVMKPDYTYTHTLALKDLMGIEFEGIFRFGYAFVHLKESNGIWKGLPQAIPFGDQSIRFEYERVEARLGEFVRIRPINTEVLAWTRLGRSHYGYEYTLGRSTPAPDSVLSVASIIHKKIGEVGGGIIYYGMRLGLHYSRLGHPDYRELFRRPLERYAGEPPIRVEAPETIQAEYYHVGEGITVHLVNHTYNQRILHAPTGPSKQSTPGFSPTYTVHPARTIIPVRNVTIRISKQLLGDVEVRAMDVIREEEFDVTYEKNHIIVRVPTIDEYRLVNITPKQ